jgi:hypothetical protein
VWQIAPFISHPVMLQLRIESYGINLRKDVEKISWTTTHESRECPGFTPTSPFHVFP